MTPARAATLALVRVAVKESSSLVSHTIPFNYFKRESICDPFISGFDYLTFVDIPGDTAVFLEHNNNDDDCSDPVVVDGIIFGSTRQTVLYVRLKKKTTVEPLCCGHLGDLVKCPV